jgi:hypothetical protein
MANRGGARRGAGRKSNAAKLLDAEEAGRSLAAWFTPDYQKSKWTALLGSEDENVQYKAVSYLSDRLYGKAAQSMKVDADMALEVSVKRVVADL